MTTIVEFISLPKGTHPQKVTVMAVMYFASKFQGKRQLTIAEIRDLLLEARVKNARKMNISDVLARTGSFVQSHKNEKGDLTWELTTTGTKRLKDILGTLPSQLEVEHETGTLTLLVNQIADADVKKYLEESVKCLEVGSLRACVVFLWSGSIRTLHNKMLKQSKIQLNAAISRHDSRSRYVSSVDDFAYIKDSLALQACQTMGILDKTQKTILENALDLRNDCGHPSKYNPGPKKVSAFIEDIIGIIFK